MGLRALIFLPVLLFAAGCVGGNADEDFPDVTERPQRPEADLTPERREALTRELREAQEEAVRAAAEGRETTAEDAGEDEPAQETNETESEEDQPE